MAETNRARQLYENNLITSTQWEAIENHHQKGIFSIRSEILFLLFVSVSLFTGGVGIFIYNNIDTIGHISILALIIGVSIYCFYYSFKNAPGFSYARVESPKPIYDYMVLSANLLCGIFIGYLQVQYSSFGTHTAIATLIPTTIYFFSAYYFDHKGVLSLGISGLCAFIGFSAKPTAIFHDEFSGSSLFAYYAIAMSAAIEIWNRYSQKIDFKKHFSFTFHNFAMHIVCVASISQLFDPYWLIPLVILAASVLYYTNLSRQLHSTYFMTFAFIYGFIGLSCVISHFVIYTEAYTPAIYLSPFYLLGVIMYMTKSIRSLKKESSHDSI